MDVVLISIGEHENGPTTRLKYDMIYHLKPVAFLLL